MKEQQPLTSCQNAYYQRLRRKGKIYRDDCRFNDVATMNRLVKKGYCADRGKYWSTS